MPTCKRGHIRRNGYWKKGYLRKAYTRKDKTKVKGAYVDRAWVPSTCIKDMGKPGKGPKILPPVGKELKLSRYGYSTKKTQMERRKSLVKASKSNNPLKVLRHLNLIRNYQADKTIKSTMAKDVTFLSGEYAKFKEQQGRAKRRTSKRKTSKRRTSKRKTSKRRTSKRKTSKRKTSKRRKSKKKAVRKVSKRRYSKKKTTKPKRKTSRQKKK